WTTGGRLSAARGGVRWIHGPRGRRARGPGRHPCDARQAARQPGRCQHDIPECQFWGAFAALSATWGALRDRGHVCCPAPRMRQDDDVTDPDAVPFDLAAMRKQYRADGLSEAGLAASPVEQFARWFKQAATDGGLFEPNAMIVSTADPEGRPTASTGPQKHVEVAGLDFFTSSGSRTGGELSALVHVTRRYPWHPRARQCIVNGVARRTGGDETARYFRTRPHGSQLGAWASGQ